MNIPHEWHIGSRYFVTYYGDVYYGSLHTHQDLPQGFYIIQNDKKSKFDKLEGDEKTTENYRRHGWEIKDSRIVVESYEGDENNRLGGYNEYAEHYRRGRAKYSQMFIFGAGASAYCTFGKKEEKEVFRSHKLRPPIGTEIFDEVYDTYIQRYPGVNLCLPEYESIGRDVEAYFQKNWIHLRSTYDINILKRQINVQFYLQNLIFDISQEIIEKFNRKNLYALFANKLQQYYQSQSDQKFSIVSFNYDFILDHFIEQAFSYKFRNLKDYIDYESPFHFYKPHGSCNWGWSFSSSEIEKLKSDDIPTYLFDNNVDLARLYYNHLGSFKENLAENAWGYERALHPDYLGRHTLNKNRIEIMEMGKKYYPALLLPYGDKDELIMPYDHHTRLEDIAKEVEDIFLIGWKGNEKVFNRLIDKNAKNLKKVVIVNPLEKKQKEVSSQLNEYKVYQSCQIEVVNDFEEFVLNTMDNIFE